MGTKTPLLIGAALLIAAPAAAQNAADTTNNAAAVSANTATMTDMNATAVDTNAAVPAQPVDANPAGTQGTAAPSDQLGGPTGTDTGKRGFPWGVLGLVGLVGLFGRKRG